MSLMPFAVESTGSTLDSIKDFGIDVYHYEINPVYEKAHGNFWKTAAWIRVFDDGNVEVAAQDHLTEQDKEIVAGVAEMAYRGGAKYAREREYTRVRKSKKVPVGYYRNLVWLAVRPDAEELEGLAFVKDGRPTYRDPAVLDSIDQRKTLLTQ